MNWQQIAEFFPLVITAALAVVAYFKIKPGEVGQLQTQLMDAASKSNNLLRDAVEDLEQRLELVELALVEKDREILNLKLELSWYERWFETIIAILMKEQIDFPTLEEIRKNWPDG